MENEVTGCHRRCGRRFSARFTLQRRLDKAYVGARHIPAAWVRYDLRRRPMAGFLRNGTDM
jgi:hypothetical protein